MEKDRRAEVTFMSPFNGDPATSVDGRTYGRNAFMNTTQLGSSSTGVADTVIHFLYLQKKALECIQKLSKMRQMLLLR